MILRLCHRRTQLCSRNYSQRSIDQASPLSRFRSQQLTMLRRTLLNSRRLAILVLLPSVSAGRTTNSPSFVLACAPRIGTTSSRNAALIPQCAFASASR